MPTDMTCIQSTFTWHERGRIDFYIGTSFANCPAQELFDRKQWEIGWIEAFDQAEKREVRIAARAADTVLQRLRPKS